MKLELKESLHQLVRTDSVATIETEGLVGGNHLGIGTGTDAAPLVAPNATIARALTATVDRRDAPRRRFDR